MKRYKLHYIWIYFPDLSCINFHFKNNVIYVLQKLRKLKTTGIIIYHYCMIYIYMIYIIYLNIIYLTVRFYS